MIIFTKYKFNGEVSDSRFINIEEVTEHKYSYLGHMTTVFIPLDIIVKIETILFSNPRWGHSPINEFVFSQDLKSRLMELRNKNRKVSSK